jgi:2-oxoglutarate ferredoxin oxidoreductase subunit beta
MTQEELKTPFVPNWCPGCGNLNIWEAFKNAAVQEGWDNTNTALVAGIGCHGHILNFVKLTSLEGLHGRAVPVAAGIKMANHRLNVFAHVGDGDCLGEGGNHFVHTARRNHDITVILHDNTLYALTTGQTSPATPRDMKTKSTPAGNPDDPINPLALAIASGATFVARVYSGHMDKLKDLIIEANNHKGFAFIDILQPCVTFNKVCTHAMYQQNTYYLGDDYDPTDKKEAFMKSFEFGEKSIPLGVFYKVEKPTLEEGFSQIAEKSLIEKEPKLEGLTELFKKYT